MLEVLVENKNNFPELKTIPLLKAKKEGLSKYWKELEEINFQRELLCVDCSVYPLAWIYYLGILRCLELNRVIKGNVYWFLVWTLNGKDFVPPYECVGGWARMISLYLKYNKANENTNY